MIIINGYAIDASLTESHKLPSVVTKFPIESGSKITDNVINDPRQWSCEGIVSDTPIGRFVAIRAAEGGTPSVNARNMLEAVRDAKETITVTTHLAEYDNMLMSDLEFTVDAETGDTLHFTCTFDQVIIITNNRTTVRVASPNNAGMTTKKGAPNPTAGYRGPKTITTLSNRLAAWNVTKGRWEYANAASQPGGTPVPDSDLSQGLPGQARAETNSLYFDQESDEWRNTDGTPVTQQQLNGQSGQNPTQVPNATPNGSPDADITDAFNNRPWWTHLAGG